MAYTVCILSSSELWDCSLHRCELKIENWTNINKVHWPSDTNQMAFSPVRIVVIAFCFSHQMNREFYIGFFFGKIMKIIRKFSDWCLLFEGSMSFDMYFSKTPETMQSAINERIVQTMKLSSLDCLSQTFSRTIEIYHSMKMSNQLKSLLFLLNKVSASSFYIHWLIAHNLYNNGQFST